MNRIKRNAVAIQDNNNFIRNGVLGNRRSSDCTEDISGFDSAKFTVKVGMFTGYHLVAVCRMMKG